MVNLGVVNRELGYQKVRQFVLDRFQRDVLSIWKNRMAWIATCNQDCSIARTVRNGSRDVGCVSKP